MIHSTLVNDHSIQEGGDELVEAWRKDQNAWLWIDLQDELAGAEQALLCDELGFERHLVLEAQRPRHPPGFEAFDDYIYLLLKPLTSDSEDLDFDTLQLAVFVASNLLVTRHSKDSRFLSLLRDQLKDGGYKEINPISMLAAISRRVADRYGKIILDLETRLDEIEEILFDTLSDELIEELVNYNTSLRKMRRITNYHMKAFSSLNHHMEKDQQWQDEFSDISALIERFHSLADLYQNMISDLIDGYISLNGHHLNKIMKVLTIVTVIFVPLGLLAGIYGMNFENIPELKSSYGYYILLIVMGVIAGVSLWLFKRMRWL